MIPVKNKTYVIDYHGFHPYDSYSGRAVCVGEEDIFGFYLFEILEPNPFFVNEKGSFPDSAVIKET